jgi:hypothetical protein
VHGGRVVSRSRCRRAAAGPRRPAAPRPTGVLRALGRRAERGRAISPRSRADGVGAENTDTASDQRDHRRPADLAPTVSSPRSMISSTASQRHRRTLDRHAAPRVPRPPPDHRAASPRGRAAGVHRALQHSPSTPNASSAPARRLHSPALRIDCSAAATRSTWRSHPRIPAGRMT